MEIALFMVFYLLTNLCSCSFTLSPSDLTTTENFSEILVKISQQTTSQSHPFLDWESSVNFYQESVTNFPYIVRELKVAGTTELGENIYALHMSYQYTTGVGEIIGETQEYMSDTEKPSIVIIGGHLGNSMLAHTYIMTLVSKLIHGFHQGDAQVINLLKLRHIWFVPYLNVDTYKYIESYTGSLSKVNNLQKSRKVEGSCSEFETGISLINNYAYKWANDNVGSTSTE